ncbi:uncharacterized protein LOC115457311 [Microcaecilia unicolor]|uniref:Uncharacterized protein LOC115457311 n=1 Tax=Microcaecilia unicolor TaxID=1415580 RepID=A0A6P7WH50_9AMPH|nr:uncharacterized protein LOC115457311 [Microcaecilia unicolor]
MILGLLLSFISAVQAAVVLTQSGSETKQAGQSLQLSCKTSGFDVNDYWMSWFRQPPRGSLEWLANVGAKTSGRFHSKDLEGRIEAWKDYGTQGIGSVCFSNGLGGSLNYLLASDKFCNNHFAKVQDIPLAASEWSYHASDSISTSKDPPDASPKPCALDTASRTQETKEEGDRHPTEELRVRKRVERKCRHHKLGKAFDREMLREAQYLSLLDKMDLETQEDLDRWYSLGSRKLVK